ncbi:3TM-type holin [Paremcibacter congregatus]|uniref:3TM-type holin n=1 Tax=Paremcibacter congregatus TaxID=2043170 RepID=UPI0030ED871F|tara:strand:- start:17374 stop:17754 length:381 start_codon:yes stop_codon:yes gene_type:complete
MLGKLLQPLLGGIFGIIDKSVTDKDMAQKIKFDLQAAAMAGQMKELETAAAVIVAEAQGGSWLQRSWRPLVMLIFTALVVAKWLGFTAPGVSEEIELKLLNIIQIGLGGYIVGRSGEKIISKWKGS